MDHRKTGKVCPTAVIEPIELLGSVIERVTLCSLQEIEKLDLQINEKVWVEKRGDVIPKIFPYDEEYASSLNQVPITLPEVCPTCGSRLKRVGADLFCKNDECPAQLGGRIEAICKLLEIKGFGEIVCDQLVEAGRVKRISDLFKLEPIDLQKACGYREENSNKLIGRLKERLAKGITLAEFIACLQIPNIGITIGSKMADYYDSVEELLFFAIQGDVKKFTKPLGETAGIALYKGFLKLEDDINAIQDQVRLVKPQTKDDSEYHGAFCFTGFRDKELSKQLDDLGYKELSSVTKACTLLVSKDTSKVSGKLEKAKKMGVKILSLAQLKEHLANGTLD